MKIAIDVRELCGAPTGVGRYLSELLTEWAAGAAHDRHDWTLYAHDVPAVPADFRRHVRILPGAGGTRWEQWDLARRLAADRPDVLFAPAYTAPLTAPCPVVLTIHDVSFFDCRDDFRWREGLRRRQVTAWAARRARIVLTVSEFSSGRIVDRIGLPPGRVRVIYHGMRSPARDEATTAAAREPMVLYVGSIFPRRHVDVLIETFGTRVVPRVAGARLEIIGAERLPADLSAEVWRQRLPEAAQQQVTLRSWVDDETLRDLYGRARAFVFLSEYEGFGLTPLEALAAGVPPIVLDTPVAREIYQDAARYVAREGLSTSGSLGQALTDLLLDAGARDEVLRHAPALLARYRWDRTADLTLSAIEEAGSA